MNLNTHLFHIFAIAATLTFGTGVKALADSDLPLSSGKIQINGTSSPANDLEHSLVPDSDLEKPISPTPQHLTEIMQSIAAAVHASFPQAEVYLSGGVAQELIRRQGRSWDWVARDLDTVVVTNGAVDPVEVAKIYDRLQRLAPVRMAPSASPERMIKLTHRGLTTEIGFFPDGQAMALRGFFSIDKVKLKFFSEQDSIEAAITEFHNPAKAKKDRVYDPYHAIEASEKGEFFLIDGPETKKLESASLALLAVRTSLKLGSFGVPNNVKLEIESRLSQQKAEDFKPRTYLNKFLSKILWDKKMTQEIKLIAELKGFEAWSPVLQGKLSRMSQKQINDSMGVHGEAEKNLRRLIEIAPPAEAKRLASQLVKYYPRLLNSCSYLF